MKSLFIDTATDTGVIGLFENDLLLQSRSYPHAFSNSHLLLPAILELVPDIGVLDYIAVGIGPGSYTGIRVAVATAKGLAFGAKLPLVGISTLGGFVAEGNYVAAIDAKVGGVYCLKNGRVGEEQLLSLEEFEKEAACVDVIVTPAREPLVARLPQLENKIVAMQPSLAEFGKLSYRAFLEGKGITGGEFPLLYLRKTQAEIEKNL